MEAISLFATQGGKTKTGFFLLQDDNQEPFNVRLHLAKDILTIQEQDVICVSGEPFYSSINGINVRTYRHEELVQVLRNAGEEVSLTVSFLKKTPAFLKLPLSEDCALQYEINIEATLVSVNKGWDHIYYVKIAISFYVSGNSLIHKTHSKTNQIKKINRNFPVNQQYLSDLHDLTAEMAKL
ncbi:UNVERIFIED_CONTAM: hypothetical protein FKN15_019581 [Acipenser sinensis]